MRKSLLLILPLLFVGVFAANASVEFFYGFGCPHCARVESSGILDQISQLGVPVQKFEIYHNKENAQLFVSYCEQFGLGKYERGVPFLVVHCNGKATYILGDSPIIQNTLPFVQTCIEQGSLPQGVKTFEVSPPEQITHHITLGAVIVSALIDSINPCAFAVLIMLLAALFAARTSKTKLLRNSAAYIVAVYLTYFLAGLGIFKAIQSFTQITFYIALIAAAVAIGVGLLQFKDALAPDKMIVRIPKQLKPTILKYAKSATSLPAAFLYGFMVSMFELPCTGGIYLAILSLMAINKVQALPYLLLYNLIFVLPLIIIVAVTYWGASPEKLEKWRLKERSWMKIASGVLMLALGGWLLWSLF